MRIAVMQPYFFPYIGYFQLINAVDKYVFYDDVNFIKNGWINRNRILINNEAKYITYSLKNASSNALIKDIEIKGDYRKILRSIEYAYKKAPYFENIWPLINSCFLDDCVYIRDVAIKSVKMVSAYLQIGTVFELSSLNYSETKRLNRTERLIEICIINKANEYINMEGGSFLYDKGDFLKKQIDLKFLKSNSINYKQFQNEFIPNLSIIDILMFNHPITVKGFLNNFSLL